MFLAIAEHNVDSAIQVYVQTLALPQTATARPVPRQIHISEDSILEMDGSGFEPISFHRIDSIYALIRSWENHREFKIEFNDGYATRYTCPVRDTLLAMLLDMCKASGNQRVIVTDEVSDGLRLMPRFAEEDYQASIKDTFFGSSSIEAWYLNRLSKACKQTLDADEVVQACCELNANVPCPGVSPNADINLVKTALTGVLMTVQSELAKVESSENPRVVAILLQTIFRLIPCIHGYKTFVEVKEVDTRQLIFQLLHFEHDFINYWTLEVLMVLCRCPLLPRNTQQEFVNKHTLLNERTLICLLDLMSNKIAPYELDDNPNTTETGDESAPNGNTHSPNENPSSMSTVSSMTNSVAPNPSHIPMASIGSPGDHSITRSTTVFTNSSVGVKEIF
jgi:hypothetical protein